MACLGGLVPGLSTIRFELAAARENRMGRFSRIGALPCLFMIEGMEAYSGLRRNRTPAKLRASLLAAGEPRAGVSCGRVQAAFFLERSDYPYVFFDDNSSCLEPRMRLVPCVKPYGLSGWECRG